MHLSEEMCYILWICTVSIKTISIKASKIKVGCQGPVTLSPRNGGHWLCLAGFWSGWPTRAKWPPGLDRPGGSYGVFLLLMAVGHPETM